MAEKHELNITISKDGKINIEVQGVKGSKCLELTKDIEDELGVVLSREKKSEFYQQDTGTNINTDIGNNN